ncbi:hypothetical protein JTE90_010835 [Oedothorax gibbosus]|uniref:Uncharacterized protein n=1 Tax=Oedothorax gibbosus TaxID=931172 RepID=A0AAV6V5P2_9ARAC|nr:hypothetical protein JTE90_010835 [Oedothorax gibbosus]
MPLSHSRKENSPKDVLDLIFKNRCEKSMLFPSIKINMLLECQMGFIKALATKAAAAQATRGQADNVSEWKCCASPPGVAILDRCLGREAAVRPVGRPEATVQPMGREASRAGRAQEHQTDSLDKTLSVRGEQFHVEKTFGTISAPTYQGQFLE